MAPYEVSCRDTKKIYIPVLPTPALQWISQGPVFGLSRSFLPYCEARARTTSINCSKTEACKFEKNNENKYIFLFSELMPIRVKTKNTTQPPCSFIRDFRVADASYIGSKFRKHQLGSTYQQLDSSNQILKSRIQLTELLTLPEFQLQ